MREKFWELPLEVLTKTEWEALCDGCGLCCINKLEDEDTGEILYTNVACNLLDLKSCQCKHYPTRHQYVPECIELSIDDIETFPWLPQSCAYRLRFEEKALPEWHYLISEDKSLVRKVGLLKNIQLISESSMSRHKDLEDYVIEDLTEL
ncbi:YcgN family cysteine cluster protein [Ignatzschineria sp. LJL83]